MPTFGALQVSPATIISAIKTQIQSTCSAVIAPAFVYLADEFDSLPPEQMASNQSAAVVCWPQISDAQWQQGGDALLVMRSTVTVKLFLRVQLDPMPRMDQAILNNVGWDRAAYTVLSNLSQWSPVNGSNQCYLMEPTVGLGYQKVRKSEMDGFHQVNVKVSVLFRHPGG